MYSGEKKQREEGKNALVSLSQNLLGIGHLLGMERVRHEGFLSLPSPFGEALEWPMIVSMAFPLRPGES